MGRRWSIVACAAYAVVVGLLTLGPSPSQLLFAVTERVSGLDRLSFMTVEQAANVLMFVPIGFLLCLSLPRLSPLLAWLLCSLASLGLELVQMLLPGREPTIRDVVLNSVGAALGVLLRVLVVRIRRPRSPG